MKYYESEALPPFDTRPEILLHPQIPKPLHTLNPRNLMGKAWWDKKRREAYKKYDYRCWACGASNTRLEGHEMYEIDYRTCTSTFKEVVALCNACHMYIHAGMLQVLLEEGKVTHERAQAIIDHGDKVLKEGIKAGKLTERAMSEATYAPPFDDATWGKWRLVIDGKKFKPKFKNFFEWEAFFS